MAINFNVRNDNAISQLRQHPEIAGNIGPGYIAVDSTIVVSHALAVEYYRVTVLPLAAGERGKIGKSRFLDSLKSYVRENGLSLLEFVHAAQTSLIESADAPAIDNRAQSETAVKSLVGSGDLNVPAIAFLLNAKTLAAVIEREYAIAETAGAQLPSYTLPGLKLAVRAAIAAIGRAGISVIEPRAAATLAAFNAVPLLFSGPPATALPVDSAAASAALVALVESGNATVTAVAGNESLPTANPTLPADTSAESALSSAAVESTTATGGTELEPVPAGAVSSAHVRNARKRGRR